MVKCYSLGAAQEVTGSKHIIEIDGRSFMIDCGAFQGRRNESDQKNRDFEFAADKIESVILTHAHYDHCGLLPVLTKNGYGGSIYATPATRDLANIVMMDSARIQARHAEFLAKQASKKGEKFNWKPLFNENDCVKAANQIITVGYNRKMFIAPESVMPRSAKRRSASSLTLASSLMVKFLFWVSVDIIDLLD